MIARILVGKNGTKELGVSMKNVWRLEVPESGVKIAELRNWLKTNYLSTKNGETMVFWINGADNLSERCQNMLLKPLEEARDEVLFVLTVKSAARLLPTITSRCKVEGRTGRMTSERNEAWEELVEAWKKGPGASMALLDKWEKDKEIEFLDFFIRKLAKGLRAWPSAKRVRMLELGLELRKDVELMVNRKLLLGRFLLEGWQISGLDSSSGI